MRNASKTGSLIIALLLTAVSAWAQSGKDIIPTHGYITETGDTVIMVYMNEVLVTEKLSKKIAKKREANRRLKYNVYKVYPYAVIAADVLRDVDAKMAAITDKKERRKYLKSVEKELNKRFKGELKDLSITQGQVLVKLINRQTGKNCYSIIKELKSGFSAVVWQSVAVIFSNNLKKEYDPQGEDAEMEAIVQELEQNNYQRYQVMLQQQGKKAFQP